MPYTKCVVCDKKGVLVTFPSDEKMFRKWVEILNISDKVKIGERKKICIEHFDAKHHEILKNVSTRRSRFLLPIPQSLTTTTTSNQPASSSISLLSSFTERNQPNYELMLKIKDEKIKELKDQLKLMINENKKLKEKQQKIDEKLQSLNSNAQILIDCLSNAKKKYKYDDYQKQFFQKFYYKHPSAYLYLNELVGFPFPAKTSLLRWQSFKNLSLGIIPEMISFLKDTKNNLSADDRKLVLIFDEMDGRLSLDYDSKKDEVVGFEHIIKKSGKLAKKFLTLMISSLNGKLRNLIIANFAASSGVTGIFLFVLFLYNFPSLFELFEFIQYYIYVI